MPRDKKGIFNQLAKQHNEIADNAAKVGSEIDTTVQDWVPTGSSVLDATLSNKAEGGGWPCGRIIELFGEESIGKSSLCYQAIAEAQKKGGIGIYQDIEQAQSKEMMKACGVDTDMLLYSNLNVIEDIFPAIEKNLNTIADSEYADYPNIVVLDSIAQMTTEAEMEDDYDQNMNVATLKAKQLGHSLRKIVPFLQKANASLLFVNQTREKVGISFGSPIVTPGGNAKNFAASIRVHMTSSKPVVEQNKKVWEIYNKQFEEYQQGKRLKPNKPKTDEVTVGYDVNIKVEKNKVAPPKRKAQFRLLFFEGVRDELSLFYKGLEFGLIEKVSKSHYKIVGYENSGSFTEQGEKQGVVTFLRGNPDIYEHLKKEVKLNLVMNDEFQPLDSSEEESEDGLVEEDGKLVDEESGEVVEEDNSEEEQNEDKEKE